MPETTREELARANRTALDIRFPKSVREVALREVRRIEILYDVNVIGSMNYGGKA